VLAQIDSKASELERTTAELAQIQAARDSLEELLEKQTAQTAQRQQVRGNACPPRHAVSSSMAIA